MAQVYLSVGSNIDRDRNIASVLDVLAAKFGNLRVSSIYESEAVGFDGDPFYNLVIGLNTEFSVGDLFEELRDIEFQHGRCRSGAHFSSRTLDVDILVCDDKVGEIDGVKLPRDEILHNAFVLQPLAELVPDELHPTENKMYKQLWGEYDKSRQKLWTVDFVWRGERISSRGRSTLDVRR